jgi:hypothetical protein
MEGDSVEVTYQLTPEDREAFIDRLLVADPMIRGSVAGIRRARRTARFILGATAISFVVAAILVRTMPVLSDPTRTYASAVLLFFGIFFGFRAAAGGDSAEDRCREALDKANWMPLRGSTDTVFCDGTELRVSGEAGYEVSRPGSIERVDADERVIIVYKPNQTMVSIPKRAFASSEDADAFVALVRQLIPADR